MVCLTYVQVQTMSALFPAQALTNAPGNVAAFTFGGANPPSHAGDFSSSFSSFESSEHPGKRTNEVCCRHHGVSNVCLTEPVGVLRADSGASVPRGIRARV